MKFSITQLPLNPEEILEAAQRSARAQTYKYGTALIRLDISEPCSLYIRGEDGFRLVISDAESRSDDEWVNEFLHEGMTASYHYADDSGKEWPLGTLHRDRALAVYEKRPDLESRLLEVGKKFLWSFSTFVETTHKRMQERGAGMKSQDPVYEVECCHNKDGLSSHITERLPEGTPLYLAPGAKGEEK